MNIQVSTFSGITDNDGVIFAEDNTILIVCTKAHEAYMIPDGVISIVHGAFMGSKELKSITLPDSLEHIGEDVFRDCTGITSIVLPNGIEMIEYGAFWDCINLANVTIPDGIKYVGEYAFHGCESLQSVVFKGKTYNTIIRDCYNNRKGRDLPQEFYDDVNGK